MENETVAPKKRLGQNFLAQVGSAQKLIRAAEAGAEETLLEIGPGTGNLTAELVKTGNPIFAVEKDPDMAAILRKRFAGAKNFNLATADILKFDETKIPAPYRIIANLPFYAGAPIIRKFLESKNPPRAMALILQKEVAQRICARPPKMNLLALAVQFYAAPKIISYIAKGSFWPAPKVDAAILLLTLLPKTGERADRRFAQKFFAAARAGFSHPRKILAGNLAQGLKLPREKVVAALEKTNLSANCRAQDLPREAWIALARALEFQSMQ